MSEPRSTPLDLDGQVALITGAASGIGRACAVRLAAAGASVVLADRSDASDAVSHIRSGGGVVTEVRMDVRSRDGWAVAVESCLDSFGRVDFLGNVAGVVNTLSEDSVVGLTDEAWDYVLDINLRGTWLGMQAVIPQMRKQGGGRIVNIASAAALRGTFDSAAYTASKAGVVGLTRQAARAYAADAILINAIAPGTIDTPIFGPSATQEFKDSMAQFHLIKRLGRPDEIAGKMQYFFSPDGSFSTGQIESVDGGWSANGNTC